MFCNPYEQCFYLPANVIELHRPLLSEKKKNLNDQLQYHQETQVNKSNRLRTRLIETLREIGLFSRASARREA